MRRDAKRTASTHFKKTKAAARFERTAAMRADAAGASALRRGRRRRRRRTGTALSHELIELGLVASETQPVEKLPELALLLFEAPQRLGPILVEGVIAARWLLPPPLCRLPQAIRAMPAADVSLLPTTYASHASAPYEKGQDRETQRPRPDKGHDHERNPRSHAPLIKFRYDGHSTPHGVNVNNINIAPTNDLSSVR